MVSPRIISSMVSVVVAVVACFTVGKHQPLDLHGAPRWTWVIPKTWKNPPATYDNWKILWEKRWVKLRLAYSVRLSEFIAIQWISLISRRFKNIGEQVQERNLH